MNNPIFYNLTGLHLILAGISIGIDKGKLTMIKTCLQCNKEYEASYKAQKHCGKVCASIARGSKRHTIRYCPVCEKGFTSPYPKVRFCSRACTNKANASIQRVNCKTCGKEFKPRSRDEMDCCSRECGWAFAGYMKTERAFYRNMAKRAKKRGNPVCVCVVCGETFNKSAMSNRRTCGDECYKTFNRVISAYHNIRDRDRKKCKTCGNGFQPTSSSIIDCLDCRIDNDKRLMQMSKARRRHRIRCKAKHQPYNRQDIFARSNFKCVKCGSSTTKEHGVNHNSYPHLDHIVPLSRNGDDTEDNVRLLCRKCNMDKGAKLDSEWITNE